MCYRKLKKNDKIFINGKIETDMIINIKNTTVLYWTLTKKHIKYQKTYKISKKDWQNKTLGDTIYRVNV